MPASTVVREIVFAVPTFSVPSTSFFPTVLHPRGLTFTWWGRYGSCLRREPTELAHSFCSVLESVSVLMDLSTVFHSINSPDNSVFTLYSSGPISALLVLSTICFL